MYYIWYYGTTYIRRHTPFIRTVTSSQPKNEDKPRKNGKDSKDCIREEMQYSKYET